MLTQMSETAEGEIIRCVHYDMWYCSETTLTGESRFHISTRGFEPGSLMTGSKRVDEMLNLHCILKELSLDFLMGLINFSATHTYLVLDPIFLQKTACLVSWEGSVCGPCGQGCHFGRGGGGTHSSDKERQLAPDIGRGKTWLTVRWEDEERMTKTTPSQLQNASMHRVSVDVHSWRTKNKFIVIYVWQYNCVLTIFIVPGK
jgi:hypothetical protein